MTALDLFAYFDVMFGLVDITIQIFFYCHSKNIAKNLATACTVYKGLLTRNMISCRAMSDNILRHSYLVGTAPNFGRMVSHDPGANPTIVSCNANAVKIYNATSSLERFQNKT
jgi:hypothetical protein